MDPRPQPASPVLAAPSSRAMSRSEMLRDLALALGFCAGYLLLDRLSYIHPMQSLGITPWNPQPALAIALLALRGQAWLPVVFLAIFAAEVLVRDVAFPWLPALALAGVLAFAYAAIARALTAPWRIRRSLEARSDVTRLIVVVVLGALATAVLYVTSLLALGTRLAEGVAIAALKFWIGDCVGILVTLPLLFMVLEPMRRAQLRDLVRRGESAAQVCAVAGALWLVFGVFGDEPFKFFYLLFLPLIWIAARDGLPGAVLAVAVIQWGIIVAVQAGGAPVVTVFELQALQMALTITGLFIGVTVDERERSAEALRQSSRLAAAGSMAGALAHELNQPLAALSGYAKAAQLLAGAQPIDTARLHHTLDRIVAETHRAAGVVQNVRHFFQSGAPHRSATDIAALVETVVASLRARAAAEHVEIAAHVAAALPPVSLDAGQIQLVVRNLLMNAIEAAVEGEARPRSVLITLDAARPAEVRVTVQDSGRGIAPELAEKIFEPFFTSKATGMGMGLSISRAIVDAHGGSLEAQPGPRGKLVLCLPVAASSVSA